MTHDRPHRGDVMTHDPGLVERVRKVTHVAGWGCKVTDEKRGHRLPVDIAVARAVLDLLAAEGRLCDPTEDNRRWGE